MAQCPNCQNEIEDDFGLVTCGSCGAQVLLAMDGSSELAGGVSPVPEAAVVHETAEAVPLPATPDMSEIATFGNSSTSTAREGSLRFNIFLSGIDSTDLRNQVQEALTDERFLWDAEALLAQSKNGVLKITDVSAVKSSLLIQRLRSIAIDIRWEQYAIHQ